MKNIFDLDYVTLLKELRCQDDPQHRIDAAKFLLTNFDNPGRIAYLVNAVLYDPLVEVRTQVKTMLFELYGNQLDNILKVEGMDGIPIEDPWIIPCCIAQNKTEATHKHSYI